jgi:hypothetical protein
MCSPQRRSQPAASSLKFSLGTPNRLECFRNRGQARRDLRSRLSPAGHERGFRARGEASFFS